MVAEQKMKGTEALDGGAKPDKKESKPAAKKTAAKKSAKGKSKGGPTRIITSKLSDGTFHHEHQFDDWKQNAQYSSANADDAGAHVAEMMGGGGDPDEGDEGDEEAAAAAQQPAAGAAQ